MAPSFLLRCSLILTLCHQAPLRPLEAPLTTQTGAGLM